MATILVIDDDEDLRNNIKIFLEGEGHKIILGKDGRDGLNILKKLKPDLIILDVMMPNLSGYDTAKIIRSEISSTVPILFLTILNTSNDLVTSFDVGGSEFMTKPFDLKKLKDTVNKLLTSKSQKRINIHKL